MVCIQNFELGVPVSVRNDRRTLLRSNVSNVD